MGQTSTHKHKPTHVLNTTYYITYRTPPSTNLQPPHTQETHHPREHPTEETIPRRQHQEVQESQ